MKSYECLFKGSMKESITRISSNSHVLLRVQPIPAVAPQKHLKPDRLHVSSFIRPGISGKVIPKTPAAR